MITLRPYRPDDAYAVVTLWWDSWHSIRPGLQHPHSLADFRARWAGQMVSRHEIVVADDDGAVVGFAVADVSDRELSQLFVDRHRKRQGLGRRLLAWAQDVMPQGFTLQTLVDNATSRAFYERHGLVAGETRINRVNGMQTIEYRWTPRAEDREEGHR
jgi:putative acetyltransferase